MKYVVLAALLMMPATVSAKTAPPPAAVPTTPQVGATIIGKDNQNAGTVAQTTATAIVIDTGTNKVPVPIAAVGVNPKGYWIGMTRAELDAAFVQASQQAQASFAAQLTPGKMVHGSDGAMLGTIKATDAQSVTITTPTGDARFPIASFGPGPDNSVVIGLTAAQMTAAVGGVPTPQ